MTLASATDVESRGIAVATVPRAARREKMSMVADNMQGFVN